MTIISGRDRPRALLQQLIGHRFGQDDGIGGKRRTRSAARRESQADKAGKAQHSQHA
jgi:hypothetical protein